MKPSRPKSHATLIPDTIGQLVAGARQKLKQAVYLGMIPHDLTPQQYWMMLVLIEQGPMSLHKLAQHVFVDDPTASRLVKSLVDRRIFITSCDPNHGRRIVISFGPEGEALKGAILGFTQDLREGIQEGMSEEELAQVVNLMGKVLANLDACAQRYRQAVEASRKGETPEA